MKSLICTTFALLGSAAILPAATTFTENFSSNTAGPNMTLGSGFGSPTTSFAAGNFRITSGANSRIYLGTNDSNYYLSNFTFQATVTIPNTTDPWAIAFIGMGNANATGGSGEPGTPRIGMALRNDTNNLEERDNASVAAKITGVSGIPNATHTLRMQWDATTKIATLGYDAANDGIFESSFTVNGADNGFDGTNSKLFVGGGNGLIFDNISIVPEPSAALLGGLGMLALLRRRRA